MSARGALAFVVLVASGCAGAPATSGGFDGPIGGGGDAPGPAEASGDVRETGGVADAHDARDAGGAIDIASAGDIGGTAGDVGTAGDARDAGSAGLVWFRAPTAMTNKQAAQYCDQLSQDGASDWRVAAPEELATWPNLAVDSNAYVTGPTYIPATALSVEDGCRGNSHSCNLTQYNAGALACAWQGVGFVGPTVCVRGVAPPGSLATKLAATTCDACRPHVTGASPEFKIADCAPFAP